MSLYPHTSAPCGDNQPSTISTNANITNDNNTDTRGCLTSSATVNNTFYNNFIELIFNDRLMIFSPTENVLYDIQLTSSFLILQRQLQETFTGSTSFAAVLDDTATDDKLVYAFTNGTIALFAVMNKTL